MKQWQKDKNRLGKKYHSTTHYLLSALIPYSEANLKLSFKPSLFFNDLEKLDQLKVSRKSLHNTYYRAIKKGLVELDDQNIPRLTPKGRRKIQPFQAKKLKGAQLMVVFDIPEQERKKRDHLRLLLKELSFEQIQKSVWASGKDHRDYLATEIQSYQLSDYVQIFESRRLKNK